MTFVWLRTTSALNGGNQFDKFTLVQTGFNRDLQRVLAREFVHSALRNGIGNEDLRYHRSLLLIKERRFPNRPERDRNIGL